MSLSSSLSAAITGLSATARRAEVVSSNVANASTPGYAARDVELVSMGLGSSGSGVRVVGVTRNVDPILLSERRTAESAFEGAATQAGFQRDLVNAIGEPTDANSLGAAVTRFETALVDASTRPESDARLISVVNAGGDLALKLNTISDQISASRQNADAEIGLTVERLNTALQQVADLNLQIRQTLGTGRDAASLMDQRQTVVDSIAREIPLHEVDRGRGQIALYSKGGIALLDGAPAELEFATSPLITPGMTVGGGALSQISVNGRPVDPLSRYSSLSGGRLEALFAVRDIDAPQAQARVDAVARDFVERFQSADVDPTLMPGDPGLFTDAGGPFVTTDELGLAGRLTFSPLVDPAEGGDVTRLRDGLGATTPGPIGNSAQIQRFATALSAGRTTISTEFSAASRSSQDLVSDLLSLVSTDRAAREATESFNSARLTTLQNDELANGVDTDYEMQQLLLIEQAYAANARIIQTVGEMLDILQRL